MRVVTVALGFSLVASTATAQVIQTNRVKVQPPVKGAATPEGAATQSSATESPKMVEALTQLQLAAGADTPTVTIQGLKFYLSPTNDKWRFYVSSMLPTTVEEKTTTDTSTTPPTPSDFLKANLLDENGGLVNASVGYYGRVAKGNADRTDDNHGLLFDFRTGVKLIDLPGDDAEETGLSKAFSPFWATAASLTYAVGLYDMSPSDKRKRAGGLVFSMSALMTYAADVDYTTLFATELKRGLLNLNVNAVISLPSAMYISIGGTAYCNDPALGKRFVVSLNAMR